MKFKLVTVLFSAALIGCGKKAIEAPPTTWKITPLQRCESWSGASNVTSVPDSLADGVSHTQFQLDGRWVTIQGGIAIEEERPR